ncbi:MAG: hypothetical protein HRU20_11885 [Pseudomonadales bacterium]|nr:hypothetical protein [Pseudomonadales bacterium]
MNNENRIKLLKNKLIGQTNGSGFFIMNKIGTCKQGSIITPIAGLFIADIFNHQLQKPGLTQRAKIKSQVDLGLGLLQQVGITIGGQRLA